MPSPSDVGFHTMPPPGKLLQAARGAFAVDGDEVGDPVFTAVVVGVVGAGFGAGVAAGFGVVVVLVAVVDPPPELESSIKSSMKQPDNAKVNDPTIATLARRSQRFLAVFVSNFIRQLSWKWWRLSDFDCVQQCPD
ncbi:MAG: hypothetical protein DHS20C01_13070 [marine bacterium B5-7]|nr:MAG: hypothetical protein DHS20C01_13070 [marine bacterium B5-7]